MELQAIYRKTDPGREEIAQRGGTLGALQRRVLILIDGKKPVNELCAFVRVGELDDAVRLLLEAGLIEHTDQVAPLRAPTAPGFVSADASSAPRPATSVPEFEKVRAQASDFVSDRLGTSGEPICEAISRCNSPEDLRKLLRGIEIFVGQRLSVETTRSFARHFGSLLL